jgi:hypothetical protein
MLRGAGGDSLGMKFLSLQFVARQSCFFFDGFQAISPVGLSLAGKMSENAGQFKRRKGAACG